jgi:hypothetical protein
MYDRIGKRSRCEAVSEGSGQRCTNCLGSSRRRDRQADVGQTWRILVRPPRRGDAHVVGQPAGAKEPPRRPREFRGNRNDEEVVWGWGERMTGARVGEIKDVAADTCPETVFSFARDDEESLARSGPGMRVAVVGALFRSKRLISVPLRPPDGQSIR